MKKVLLVIVLICFAVVIGLETKMILKVSENSNGLKTEISSLKQEIANLSNRVEENETSKTEKEDKKKKTSEFSRDTQVSFDPEKMKIYRKNVEYAEANNLEHVSKPEDFGINIKIEDGEVYVSTDSSKEYYNDLFKNVDEIEDQKIEGFETKVDEVRVSVFGQDLSAPIILFLMDDGTVEYVESEKMLKDKKYKSAGKIEDLENIVDVVYADAQENETGYITTLAIDQDGYAYDLGEILNL